MRKVDEALLKAAETGDYDAVVDAIEAGANVNAKDQYGETALM